MKKFVSLQLVIGMMVVWAVAASAAPNDPPQTNQNQGATATQEGVQDKRIITPEMNALERLQTQRAIQKRAAASRNALMMQAAQQEKQQAENAAGEAGAK